MQQATIRSGRVVGVLATDLFAGGVCVAADHEHHDAAVEETQGLMANPDVPSIFEAGFMHESVRVRVDVLERGDAGCWHVTEVKSGLDVKPINLDDLALQCWVMRGSGVDVDRASLMTLNRRYRREDNLALERLFVVHDCTAEVCERFDRVGRDIDTFTNMLRASSPPVVRPAKQCWDPFPCPYRGHCFDEVGSGHPLSELPGLPASRCAELAARGICDIAGLPDGEPLSEEQARVRDCVRTGEEFVSETLADELDELQYPVHHVRLGVVRPAVPRFRHMRPYQLFPYIWSDHVEHEDGSVVHSEYLCRECRDPRDELAHALLASLGERGTVCTYGPLEARMVGELGGQLPHLAGPLRRLSERIVDVRRLVTAHYYHRDLHGSFASERVATVLGVPCGSQSGLRDEYAAGVVYDESTEASVESCVEAQERLLRFFARCSKALLELRRALRARAAR